MGSPARKMMSTDSSASSGIRPASINSVVATPRALRAKAARGRRNTNLSSIRIKSLTKRTFRVVKACAAQFNHQLRGPLVDGLRLDVRNFCDQFRLATKRADQLGSVFSGRQELWRGEWDVHEPAPRFCTSGTRDHTQVVDRGVQAYEPPPVCPSSQKRMRKAAGQDAEPQSGLPLSGRSVH